MFFSCDVYKNFSTPFVDGLCLLVDSHSHLAEDELKPFLEWILPTCRNNNTIIFANSTDLKSCIVNIELAYGYSDIVKPFVGVHPWEAQSFEGGAFKDFVVNNLGNIVGIGEIGLDGKYSNKVSLEIQRRAFEFQLEIAEEFGLPVCIHSRRAQDEVLNILNNFLVKGVLLHWFSGSEEQMKNGLDRGYFFSFGPTIAYSKGSQRLLSKCDLDKVLLETDSPVPYGACFENRTSTPLLIYTVAYKASNIFKKDLEETLNIISKNSQNYIGRRISWR